MKHLQLLQALVLMVAFGTAATAHDFWVQAKSLRNSVDQPISLDLRVGHPLDYESVVRSKKLVDRFVVTDALGEREVLGREGTAPAGFTRSRTPGPLVASYAGKPQALVMEPAKFEAYLLEEGLETIIAWRKEHGESTKAGRERYARCAKTIFEIESSGKEERSPAQQAMDRRLRALDCGLKLELFPLPVEAKESTQEGKGSDFQLLYEGEPIEGVLVRALHMFRPNLGFDSRTDKEGRVALELEEQGPWLIKAVHMVRSEDANADWDSYWASLLLELPAAESSADSSK